ncbi:hypothetical protein QCA50_010726 [Cerrena zonata]|uniref:G-protein coupled receptors family 1 profile domain-containing protein n=1 Tax=Cerrena zonata TaxID=2478898 RepID=A0AAW0FXX9_9APHY
MSNWFIYTGTLNVLATSIVLIVRIYAMYECNRKLLVALLCLGGASMLTEFIFWEVVVRRAKIAHLPWSGCFLINTQKLAYAYRFPMIVFESTLFILAIVKSIQYALDDSTTPHLMFVVLRDSMIYFGGVLAVALTNCIVWAVGRSLFVAFTT